MVLRIDAAQWWMFSALLREEGGLETAGIVLAERVAPDVLVARELLVVPQDGYLVRRRDQLRISPVALNRLVRPARDRGLAILTIHTHPGTSEPWFSLADDMGDARLMPSFHNQTDGPHGSMVLAGASGAVVGRVFATPSQPLPLDVVAVGATLAQLTTVSEEEGEGAFDRQRLALGAAGQARLRQLRVGVVGLGGTGSACLMQLAHLGVGGLVLVDGDVVELSNISRILGACVADVGQPKVSTAARYVGRLGLGTEVVAHMGHLGQGVGVDALAGCDVVLCCVDRHSPRALLNRLAYNALIPVVDMGSAFRVGPAGQISSGAGRVVVVGPGRRCLACWGHIDPNRLREEALDDTERAAQVTEGYIQGAAVPEPSVVAFNTAVAGAAVIELLRLVTAFGGTDAPPNRLAFDFVTGVVRRNGLHGPRACSVCSPPSLADGAPGANDPDPPGLVS